jgi:hypothetical protein
MLIADESLEHQLRLSMVDNSTVGVTCNCVVNANMSFKHPKKSKKPRIRNGPSNDVDSGSFRYFLEAPVGTPTPLLMAAYREHLPADHPDRRT